MGKCDFPDKVKFDASSQNTDPDQELYRKLASKPSFLQTLSAEKIEKKY